MNLDPNQSNKFYFNPNITFNTYSFQSTAYACLTGSWHGRSYEDKLLIGNYIHRYQARMRVWL